MEGTGKGGGSCRVAGVVEVALASTSMSSMGVGFRAGQFLATAPLDFSQLIRSSALRPPPDNTGAESTTAAATAAERLVLDVTTMGETKMAAKWTPIFPHNAIQAHGP